MLPLNPLVQRGIKTMPVAGSHSRLTIVKHALKDMTELRSSEVGVILSRCFWQRTSEIHPDSRSPAHHSWTQVSTLSPRQRGQLGSQSAQPLLLPLSADGAYFCQKRCQEATETPSYVMSLRTDAWLQQRGGEARG